MKLTNIDIQPANSENTINLSFRDPTNQNPYIAKEILGLDVDVIVPKYYGSGLLGDKYYDFTMKKRDIVLKIGLNPEFSIGKTFSMLRDELYKMVSASRTGLLQVRFKNEINTIAAISGFVTKMESPTFVKNPEVNITLTCNDPVLRAVDAVSVDVSELDPVSTIITDSLSTAPHGFVFTALFNANSPAFSIKETVIPNWIFEIFLTGSSLVEFLIGDRLHFSSEPNSKRVYLERGPSIIHLADKITSTSIWPVIFPGENTFICTSAIDWESISYYPAYWGV